MTEVQAAEVIHIVLMDQRTEVLREVKAIIEDQQREIEARRTMEDPHDDEVLVEQINALDVLDARIDTLARR
jgi:hypothetical protein